MITRPVSLGNAAAKRRAASATRAAAALKAAEHQEAHGPHRAGSIPPRWKLDGFDPRGQPADRRAAAADWMTLVRACAGSRSSKRSRTAACRAVRPFVARIVGEPLFPTRASFGCSCDLPEKPCRHVLAARTAARRLDENPGGAAAARRRPAGAARQRAQTTPDGDLRRSRSAAEGRAHPDAEDADLGRASSPAQIARPRQTSPRFVAAALAALAALPAAAPARHATRQNARENQPGALARSGIGALFAPDAEFRPQSRPPRARRQAPVVVGPTRGSMRCPVPAAGRPADQSSVLRGRAMPVLAHAPCVSPTWRSSNATAPPATRHERPRARRPACSR